MARYRGSETVIQTVNRTKILSKALFSWCVGHICRISTLVKWPGCVMERRERDRLTESNESVCAMIT